MISEKICFELNIIQIEYDVIYRFTDFITNYQWNCFVVAFLYYNSISQKIHILSFDASFFLYIRARRVLRDEQSSL